MNTTKLELSVGVFMLIGILCMAYISVKLGKWSCLAATTTA